MCSECDKKSLSKSPRKSPWWLFQNPRWPPWLFGTTDKYINRHNFGTIHPRKMILVSKPRFWGMGNAIQHLQSRLYELLVCKLPKSMKKWQRNLEKHMILHWVSDEGMRNTLQQFKYWFVGIVIKEFLNLKVTVMHIFKRMASDWYMSHTTETRNDHQNGHQVIDVHVTPSVRNQHIPGKI